MGTKKLFIYICIILICASFSFAKGKKDVQEETLEERQIKAQIELSDNEGAAYKREAIESEPIQFSEVWGFATQALIHEIDFTSPLTDIALFTATLNNYAELTSVPSRSLLKSFKGKAHITFACDSRALVHFVLDKSFGLYEDFKTSLAKATKDFDGLCIDMEYIPARDRLAFLSFLKDMKKEIGKKTLSVCVPARTYTISDDIFPYKKIGEIADRVIIMAYDEHWSTSSPGPVASYEWCEKVTNYALTVIPKEKIVMGMPFYGRTWTDDKHASAWYYSGINRKMLENNVTKIERDAGGVAKIEYTATVNVTGFFDDAYSLFKKCSMYKSKEIENISFWRIGQEDKTFWQLIKID